MSEHHTLADRLRARADQLGLPPAHVAKMAGVNRSFVYDILRGRSTRPGLKRLPGRSVPLSIRPATAAR